MYEILLFLYLLVSQCHSGHLDNDLDSLSSVNVSSNLSCPSWYIPADGVCTCGNTLDSTVQCYGEDRVKVRFRFCMSYDPNTQLTLVGNCPYSNKNSTGSYVVQPKNQSLLNENLCGWINRSGLMCNSCKEGLGVAVMLYTSCVKCHGKWTGWILYFTVALVPLTLLFLLLVICRIRNSEQIRSLVCILQMLLFFVDKYPHVVVENFQGNFASVLLLIAITICGVCNLNFFRYIFPPFCITESFTTLDIIALEYIVALYPMTLTCITYVCIQLYARDYKVLQILWLPINWCLSKLPWSMNDYTLIETFSICLELSYSKIIYLSVLTC